MNSNDRQELYKKALKKWGLKSQVAAAIEEFSELNVELAKYLNNKRGGTFEIELLDELADASIMIEQMAIAFNLQDELIERKGKKLKVLERYIKNGERG